MKIIKALTLLTLMAVGCTNFIGATLPQRDLSVRTHKIKHNGALQHLVKKAAVKKAQTKERKEKLQNNLDSKKALYSIVFACLVCNIPSILAQLSSSIENSTHGTSREKCDDDHSARYMVRFSATPNVDHITNPLDWSHVSPQPWASSEPLNATQSTSCIQIADNRATITHIRPNGFIQKCNIVDNEHVICTLTNPGNGKTLCRDFTLEFNGACDHSEAGPQDTQILRELKNAIVYGNTVSIPLTVNTIQELNAHTNAASCNIMFNKGLATFALFSKPPRAIVLGKFLFDHPDISMNDNDIVFILAHEIGHATQPDNINYEKLIPLIAHGAVSVALLGFIFLTANRITTFKHCIFAMFTLVGALCYALQGSSFTKKAFGLPLNFLNDVGYSKWNLQSYRKINTELNADLLSVVISEPLQHYFTAKHSIFDAATDFTFDPHPSSLMRCTYIQEFIRKYQDILAWFSTNQRFIE